jgi:hypothetical protein
VVVRVAFYWRALKASGNREMTQTVKSVLDIGDYLEKVPRSRMFPSADTLDMPKQVTFCIQLLNICKPKNNHLAVVFHLGNTY